MDPRCCTASVSRREVAASGEEGSNHVKDRDQEGP